MERLSEEEGKRITSEAIAFITGNAMIVMDLVRLKRTIIKTPWWNILKQYNLRMKYNKMKEYAPAGYYEDLHLIARE